jgi:N-acetylmuramoyl-L-alanine amidase
MLTTALAIGLALTVVIDPGHGGSNTGAPGRVPGSYEKHVTLGIARKLQKRLEAEGVHVVMTRERDTYLTLRERARRANASGPDCFISLHTNASPEHGRRGIETYALTREAAEVAAGRIAGRQSEAVAGLLAEMDALHAHRRSIDLARALQARLVQARGAAHDRGVRQAAHDVLDGVEAPAVLVEVGFIDHPIEGRELTTEDTQQKIADALAEGVLDHTQGRQPRLAHNAH